MDLHFANPSRSYDPTRHAVRFWGYDPLHGGFVLRRRGCAPGLRISTASRGSDFLQAFDEHRDRICKVAAKVYARGPKGSYDLQAKDF